MNEKTPFEKLGFPDDAIFIVTKDVLEFPKGGLVTLYHDDGTEGPMFISVSPNNRKKGYLIFSEIRLWRRAIHISNQNTGAS